MPRTTIHCQKQDDWGTRIQHQGNTEDQVGVERSRGRGGDRVGVGMGEGMGMGVECG